MLIDYGGADATTFIAGMGRSGTTWIADVVNYDHSHRVLFEPFLPGQVKEARPFKYIHYLPPHDADPARIHAAETILSGKVRHPWVDRENRRFLYGRRIVKDIRCNLMLGWLKAIRPAMPIILVMRHPLAVAASWMQLGWGKTVDGVGDDFSIITSQTELLADFPEIDRIRRRIDPHDALEKIIFEWCVFHWVPFRQFRSDEVLLVVYENLILTPEDAARNLFCGLKRPVDYDHLRSALRTQSGTDFLKRGPSSAQVSRLTDWKNVVRPQQVGHAKDILAMFGLDGLYDHDGHPTGAQPFQK